MVLDAKNKNANVAATIFIVDDDELILDLLSEMIAALGYRAIVASSGEKAVDIFGEKFREIDLVIMDMFMPDKNGDVVFREMIKIDPDCKAVLLSGYLKAVDTKKLSNFGFMGFLDKPVRLETLEKMIQSVIG